VVYVVWPTTSCCADWSKRCHVTFVTTEWWTCWRPCRPNDIFNLGFIILMPHHLSSAYCFKPASRGIARSKYVGWTDMASAEREPITGVWRRSDPPCKNSSDLYQFQERPLAKVGWTYPPQTTPWRRHCQRYHVILRSRVNTLFQETVVRFQWAIIRNRGFKRLRVGISLICSSSRSL